MTALAPAFVAADHLMEAADPEQRGGLAARVAEPSVQPGGPLE